MKQFIKLEDFIKHGTFGKVQKHMDYSLAQSQFPKPDVQEGGWYGDHELYYGDILVEFIDNRLDCISIPMAAQMETGNLELDWGHFSDYEHLSLLYVEGILSVDRLDYTVIHEEEETVILTILQSGVTLTFWYDEDLDMDNVFDFHLVYISVD